MSLTDNRVRGGKTIDQLFPRAEIEALWWHLHNDNGINDFVMAWLETNGLKKYVKSKKRTVRNVIEWAWGTVTGKAKRKIAYVPYARNAAWVSRWGCFDFDAHGGEWERALNFAKKACDELVRQGSFVMLEESGGGYHVWAIAKEFLAVREWISLLKGIANSIGAPVQSGVCEIFPHDGGGSGPGKGVRAPGAWNPSTNTVNHILFENIGPLLAHLLSLLEKQPLAASEDFTDTKRNNSFSSPRSYEKRLYGLWMQRWSVDFGIRAPATRHKKLEKLVGEIFRQVGYEMARRIAEAQYLESTVQMRANKAEHLAEFESLWKGMTKTFIGELNEGEKKVFKLLTTDHEGDAFRIIHSYARLAKNDGRSDFPIAMRNLSQRIDVSLPGATNLRERLIEKGAIQMTQAYQPNRRAGHYRWLLDEVKPPS